MDIHMDVWMDIKTYRMILIVLSTPDIRPNPNNFINLINALALKHPVLPITYTVRTSIQRFWLKVDINKNASKLTLLANIIR